MFGQHGSAKTTALKVLRRLIDPNLVDLRALPPTERDLLVSARRSWAQGFDNLSNLSADMSDTLCRLATGGGLVLRALYTDAEEVLLTAQRPVCLNGITEVITRADLMDRSAVVTALPLKKRRKEREFWNSFDAARPALLGALYDAVACALRNADAESPDDLPRMADLTDWVSRGESAFGWASGTFLSAYRQNQLDGAEIAVEADLLATALLRFMHDEDAEGNETRKEASWTGPAAKLLEGLNTLVGERQARNKDWPQSPSALGQRLARAIPPLAQLGLQVSDAQPLQRQAFGDPEMAGGGRNAEGGGARDSSGHAEGEACSRSAAPLPGRAVNAGICTSSAGSAGRAGLFCGPQLARTEGVPARGAHASWRRTRRRMHRAHHFFRPATVYRKVWHVRHCRHCRFDLAFVRR